MPPTGSQLPDESGPTPPPSRAWWGILALVVPLLTGLLLSWHSLGDLDIWFHLRAGRDLLDGQGLSTVNRYSFAEPDHPWVNHEWMFQVLAALTGPDPELTTSTGVMPTVMGWNLLRVFLTGILLTVVLLGDRGLARLRGREGPQAAAWAGVPILAGLTLLWPRLTLRPELISYLFFVLLVRNSEHFFRMATHHPAAPSSESPDPGWRSVIDPRLPGGRLVWITLLWAQFHGFASLCFMTVALCLVLAPLQRRLFTLTPGRTDGTPPWSRAGALLALALVGLALTPNGLNGLLMPLRAIGQFSQDQVDLRTTISELVPLRDSPNSLGLTINLFQASVVWGLLWIVLTWGRVSLLRILVFGLAAAAAWTNQRSIGFYGLTFMLLHTGSGTDPWRFRLPRKWTFTSPRLTAISGTVITLLVAVLLWPPIIQDDFYLREGVSRRFGSGTNPARYPVAAAAAMAPLTDRPFFANLDAAAFLLAHTPGRIFIDGRTEAYSPDLWAEYLAVKRGDERSLGLLARRRPEAVCLATGGGSFDRLASALLAAEGWQLVTAENAGLLFQPTGGTLRAPGQPANKVLTQAAERTLAGLSGSPTRRADGCLAAGQLYGFARNRMGVEEAYRRGLSYQGNHPTLNHNLGNLLLARQEFLPALALFQKALEVNSRLAGSALNAGVCLMRLDRPGDAARFFQRATAIDPRRPEAWANLAAARIGAGDRPGAAAALVKALELRPNDARLQQRLRELKRGAG